MESLYFKKSGVGLGPVMCEFVIDCWRDAKGDNQTVKLTRPSLVQSWKQGTGGTSGLHRTAQEVTPLHREVRIRATETSRLSSGETGNLCAQQYQVGQPRGMWFAMDSVVRRNGWRVGSTEPSGRPSAQINGGHATGNRCAQNPAYRWASHFFQFMAEPAETFWGPHWL